MAQKKVRFALKSFEEIRRLPEVDALLQEHVDRVLDRVGEGYEGGVEPGRSRSRGYVVARTVEAQRAEARDHALLRALSEGGGA